MSRYAEQYRHPKWQMRRLEIMKRDKARCRSCGGDDITLNVHHSYYVSKREIWDYPDWSLTTLCENCHEQEHTGRLPDETTDQEQWESALEFLDGSLCPHDDLWDLLAEMRQLANARGVLMEDLMQYVTREAKAERLSIERAEKSEVDPEEALRRLRQMREGVQFL